MTLFYCFSGQAGSHISSMVEENFEFHFLKCPKVALYVVFQGLVYFTMVEEIFEFLPSETLQNGFILLI